MTRTFTLVALVIAMSLLAGPAGALGGAAACPQAPAATAVASLLAPAVPAQAAGLSPIFAPPSTGGTSTVPAPRWTSCTFTQCRQGCKVPGCFSNCVDLQTCTCETICQ